MNKQRIYRAGLMAPATDAGAAASITAQADLLRPEGRPGRHGSLFASPSLPGVVRWVLGNHMCRYETRVREITVDADTTWVYLIDAWEGVSWNMRGFEESKAHAFWATGMTLTEWLARAEAEGLDGSEWEVILSPDQVLSSRNVSIQRLLAAAPEWRLPELRTITRAWKRAA